MELPKGGVVGLDLLRQIGQEVGQRDTGVFGAGEPHDLRLGADQPLPRGLRAPADRGVVGEHRPGGHDQVSPVDDGLAARGAHLAPVDAGVLRVVFGEEALGVGHDRHRAAQCFGQFPEGVDGAVGAQVRPGQQDRLFRVLQKLAGPVDRGGQCPRVGGLPGQHRGSQQRVDRRRLGARGGRQVAGDLDVDGLALAQRGADRLIDQGRRVVGVQDAHRLTRHLPTYLVLVGEVVRAHRVVHDVIGDGVIGVGTRRHEDHRKAFGVGARHPVERGVRAHVVGGEHGAGPVDPGVALGGVGGIELVAAADLLEVLVRPAARRAGRGCSPRGP